MRRVVVADRPDGLSTVVADGPPAVLFQFRDQAGPHDARAELVDAVPDELLPGEGLLGELWRTDGVPQHGTPDLTGETTSWTVDCPPGATRFRTSKFSPGRTTAMHTTNTLDYDFVLQGSITLLLSDGTEHELQTGDAVVIPAVAHAWRAGPEGARLGLVMVGMAQ
jgi:quercetin dioxygenase-like cupin family protein